MMNRQVRGSEKLEWEDFGSVCINHAAETYAARHDDEFADGNTMRVQVRTENTIDPISNLLVERRTEYKVVNPRQGA